MRKHIGTLLLIVLAGYLGMPEQSRVESPESREILPGGGSSARAGDQFPPTDPGRAPAVSEESRVESRESREHALDSGLFALDSSPRSLADVFADHQLVICSASWCVPCQNYKAAYCDGDGKLLPGVFVIDADRDQALWNEVWSRTQSNKVPQSLYRERGRLLFVTGVQSADWVRARLK